MDFEIRKCKGKAALTINPKKKVRIDLLEKAKEFDCLVETPVMLIIKYEDMIINIYENGKVRVPTLDEEKAKKIAEEIYKVIL